MHTIYEIKKLYNLRSMGSARAAMRRREKVATIKILIIDNRAFFYCNGEYVKLYVHPSVQHNSEIRTEKMTITLFQYCDYTVECVIKYVCQNLILLHLCISFS